MQTTTVLTPNSLNRLKELKITNFGTIDNFMVEKEYLSQDEVSIIAKEQIHSLILPFEVVAFNQGKITDMQLIQIINDYHNIEIVSEQELFSLSMIFTSFPHDICKKYTFLEYELKLGDRLTHYLICPYGSKEVETIIKRQLENYTIRYSLSVYISKKLNDKEI